MATVIRMSRHGTKKRPFYKVVVQDHRAPRDGRFIERIGSYDPKGDGKLLINPTRLEYWLGVGAQMSDTVRRHVRVHGTQPKTEVQPAPQDQ